MLASILVASLQTGPREAKNEENARASSAPWRAHYAAVEQELLRDVPAGLTQEQLRARAQRIEALRDYRERGDFTRHELGSGLLEPRFVDAHGRRCAVAELLHASGHDELVARVARQANTAWVVELGTDPEFADWLRESGLSLEEAARIQTPAGCSSCDVHGDHAPPSSPSPPAAPSSRNPAAPPTSGPAGASAPNTAGSFLTNEPPEDSWWVWWEFNKLDYLEVRGLERRLALDDGHSPEVAAQLTEPLRRLRAPFVAPSLQDPDAGVRASAALAFGRVAKGEEVLALIPLFEDPARRVRESALFGLGASGTSEGAQVLLAVLENGGAQRAGLDPITPRALPLAILALAKGRRARMEPGIAPAVARMAARAPASVREEALWALCQFQRLAPDPAVEAEVAALLADRSRPRWVRAAAIEAMGDSNEPRVLAQLQGFLVGRDLELRRSAALALAQSPQALATAGLLTAYELESEPLTRGFLLLALGRRGGPHAREVLLEALEHGPLAVEPWAALGLGLHARAAPDARVARALLGAAAHARRENSRPAIGLALGLAHVSAAEPPARETLASSPSVRERAYAATTLALLGGSANRAFLRARLAVERSDFVRANIAQALSSLGDATDAPLLSHALEAMGDPVLQGVAAASLGLLGEPGALSTLEALLREPRASALTRATALDSLGLLLQHGDPLSLPAITRASNYTLYSDWALELFLQAL